MSAAATVQLRYRPVHDRIQTHRQMCKRDLAQSPLSTVTDHGYIIITWTGLKFSKSVLKHKRLSHVGLSFLWRLFLYYVRWYGRALNMTNKNTLLYYWNANKDTHILLCHMLGSVVISRKKAADTGSLLTHFICFSFIYEANGEELYNSRVERLLAEYLIDTLLLEFLLSPRGVRSIVSGRRGLHDAVYTLIG